MNFNLTLLGQSMAFMLFVWFCMKYVWPPVVEALRQRQQRIADGLAAADRGERRLAEADSEKADILAAAQAQAQAIVQRAKQRAEQLVDEARQKAQGEGHKQIAAAQAEIEQARQRVKEDLREQLGLLVVKGAEQVLRRELDPKTHSELIRQLSVEL